jgi:hypothetical protein
LFFINFEVKTRQYDYFVANVLVTAFGIMGLSGGLVIVNIITMIDSSRCSVFSKTCATNPHSSLNIAMIVLGAIAIVMSFVYFIALPMSTQCMFANRLSRGSVNMNMYPYNAQYGQQQQQQPMPLFPTGPQGADPNMTSQRPPPSYQETHH